MTKQPLSEPFYEVSGSAGSFDSYSGGLDLSGPLTDAGDVRYRLNLSYENYGSFRDFVDGERLQVSPILAWDISEDTSLDVFGQYTYDRETIDEGIPFDSNGQPIDVPQSRFLNEDFGEFTQDQFSLGYRLNHDFNDNLSLRHSSQYFQYEPQRYYPFVNSFDEVTVKQSGSSTLRRALIKGFLPTRNSLANSIRAVLITNFCLGSNIVTMPKIPLSSSITTFHRLMRLIPITRMNLLSRHLHFFVTIMSIRLAPTSKTKLPSLLS